MDQYTAWEHWIVANIPLIMLIVTILTLISTKLAHMYWMQHKKEEKSNIDRLVESLDRLVTRIDELFTKHDNHEARVGKLEKRIGEHFVRCNEREKLVKAIDCRQRNAIIKYDKLILERHNDIPMHTNKERGE